MSKYKAHISLLLAAIMWGLMSPIGKTVLDSGINPFFFATFRIIGGAIFFWITSLFTKSEKVDKRDLLLLFFAGMMSVVFNQGSFIYGLSLTSPVDASIITTTAPIATMIIAAIFIKEPITFKKALGVFLGSLGALTLVLSNSSNTTKEGSILGDLICLSAQISFAFYLVLFKEIIKKYSVITFMKWMFLFSAIVVMPISVYIGKDMDFMAIPSMIKLSMFYVVFCGTFLTYILMMIGQKSLRPTVISMYNYVQPVVGATTSIIIGMATFSIVKGFAVALIFTGVYIVTQSKSRAQMLAEKKIRDVK